MYSRLIKPPHGKSFFLFGPRGTGKTTWVKTNFPKAIYLDLLEAELFNDLLANPQRLGRFIPEKYKGWIIIDEVQRVPQLLNEVHRLIEKYKYKFVLTGSSARKIRKGGENLLGGRALTFFMHPFSAIELKSDFSLKHSLKYGQLPSVYVEKEPKKYLEAYVKAYLEQEIYQEGLTRNLGRFVRFLEAASFSQGCVLNISEVSRECAVERKVVENYFLILEDLLIAYHLPVFAKRAKRRLVVHPKFYFFDIGVYRTIRPMGPLDRPEEAEGVALESLFLHELKTINEALSLGYKIYYWRTASKKEVDFVLYGNKGLYAFEIKRTSRVTKAMFSGLQSFIRDYPQAKAYFVYGGKRYTREGSIEIIPIIDMLNKLPEILRGNN